PAGGAGTRQPRPALRLAGIPAGAAALPPLAPCTAPGLRGRELRHPSAPGGHADGDLPPSARPVVAGAVRQPRSGGSAGGHLAPAPGALPAAATVRRRGGGPGGRLTAQCW